MQRSLLRRLVLDLAWFKPSMRPATSSRAAILDADGRPRDGQIAWSRGQCSLACVESKGDKHLASMLSSIAVPRPSQPSRSDHVSHQDTTAALKYSPPPSSRNSVAAGPLSFTLELAPALCHPLKPRHGPFFQVYEVEDILKHKTCREAFPVSLGGTLTRSTQGSQGPPDGRLTSTFLGIASLDRILAMSFVCMMATWVILTLHLDSFCLDSSGYSSATLRKFRWLIACVGLERTAQPCSSTSM